MAAKGHDRINVQNNPVNLIDPHGLISVRTVVKFGVFGAIRGAIAGAIGGAVAGGSATGPLAGVGAIPGAIVGATSGATTGFSSGLLYGTLYEILKDRFKKHSGRVQNHYATMEDAIPDSYTDYDGACP